MPNYGMSRPLSPVGARCIPVTLLAFALLTAGCQTPAVSEPVVAPSDQLMVGMRSEKVERLLGEADSITPGQGNDYVEETWVYQIEHPPVYRTIVAEMRDVPWVDPITGEMKTLQDPVVDQQRIDRRETVTLKFRYGQLMTIDRDVDEHRSFSR